jgi:hypothetical protein
MREKPPNRRLSESVEFGFNGQDYIVTVSRYHGGRVMESFLSPLKRGSDIDINATDASVLLSFALQNGADLNDMDAAVSKNSDGSPAGIIGAMLQAIGRMR